MVLKWYIAHIKCQIKFLLKNKTIPKSNVSHLLKLVICLIKKAGRTWPLFDCINLLKKRALYKDIDKL